MASRALVMGKNASTMDEILDKIPDIASCRKVDHCPFLDTASCNEPLKNRIPNITCDIMKIQNTQKQEYTIHADLIVEVPSAIVRKNVFSIPSFKLNERQQKVCLLS